MPHTKTRRSLMTAGAAVLMLGAVLPVIASTASARPARSAIPAGRATTRSSPVQVYPSPGTSEAMPATGITFRGVAPSVARSVRVSGSVSGAHAVTARSQRDGRGVTLQPAVAFTPGEHVTVTGLAVAGGNGNEFSFTVARPAPIAAATSAIGTEPNASAGSTKSARTAEGPPYRTRPDLSPPSIPVTTPGNGTAPGVLLTTPNIARHTGAMLMDNKGQPYWYKPVTNPLLTVGDLETARYRGQNVLVWFEGLAPYGPGSYRGVYTIVDTSYRRIATVRAANGMQADIHEIDINSAGRAYIGIYNPVIRDLSAFGGSSNATVLEYVIQEIDIASGDLLFEWHSLDSFPVTDSYEALTNFPVDYMHGNSVSQDTDGNLLVSARHLSTGFKINRSTGKVMWRLGGKRNQFRFSPAGEPGPSYQHHLVRIAPGVISFYDNGRGRASRGVQYRIDETALTAVRIKEQRHNPPLAAFSQGSYEQLPGGHSLVAWGNTGFVTEYDSTGAVRFEANVPNSYRTFRSVWHGRPASVPAVVAEQRTGHDTVFVSWNGATDVTSWQVRTGPTRTSLTTALTAPRDGFETANNVPHATFVQVRGLAADNSVLGSSAVVPIGRWFSERSTHSANGHYAPPVVGDFTAGPGDDVVFYAPGPGPESLWTSATNGTFTTSSLPAVNGSYKPLVGDFVGDGHDDILWWRRGSTSAFLWRSDGAGRFTDSRIGVPAAALANVLHHRLGKAEVLWYNPGPQRDLISGYRWNSGSTPTGVRRAINVNGVYRPVIGDFDGNGWVDVVWYGPGSNQDWYWRLFGRGGSSTGQAESRLRISGSYSPLTGRFSADHDGRDDIVWYARGSAPDFVWEGTTGASFTESSHPNSANGDPILLKGALDHLYLRTPGTGGTIWVPNARPDIVRSSGNAAFGSEYQPVAGDFQGSGRSGLLWYAPGAQPERMFAPRLG